MNGAELARVARQADLLGDFKLKEQYSQMSVTGREKIDDRECTSSSERRHPHLLPGLLRPVEPKNYSSMRKLDYYCGGPC